jgi:hypothetical protein
MTLSVLLVSLRLGYDHPSGEHIRQAPGYPCCEATIRSTRASRRRMIHRPECTPSSPSRDGNCYCDERAP